MMSVRRLTKKNLAKALEQLSKTLSTNSGKFKCQDCITTAKLRSTQSSTSLQAIMAELLKDMCLAETSYLHNVPEVKADFATIRDWIALNLPKANMEQDASNTEPQPPSKKQQRKALLQQLAKSNAIIEQENNNIKNILNELQQLSSTSTNTQ